MACYITIAVIWSTYQGVRGAIEHSVTPYAGKLKRWQQWVILYIHDFAFRFVCTAVGFAALYFCHFVATHVNDWSDVGAGTASLLVASFVIGFIGVGGQLHYIVLLGKAKPFVGE